MRKIFFIVLIITTVCGIAVAEERVVEPTGFESFVARASVVLEVDEPVGTIVSTDATLAIALLVAGSARSSRRRNLRARLRADPANNSAGHGRPYLDEAQVTAAIEELALIEDGIPELKAGTDAPWRVKGTGSCWRPARPMRILCPSYGVGPEGSGLSLSAYGGNSFAFPGHRPPELALLLKKAAATLTAL